MHKFESGPANDTQATALEECRLRRRVDGYGLGPAKACNNQQQGTHWVQVRQGIEGQATVDPWSLIAKIVGSSCVAELMDGKRHDQDDDAGDQRGWIKVEHVDTPLVRIIPSTGKA